MSVRSCWADAKIFFLVFFAFILVVHAFPIGSSFLRFNVLLGVPLFGTLVRFRVNYTPKKKEETVAGDGEVELGLEEVRTGAEGEENVRGYAHMMRTVYSVERWGGLYKSTVPALLFWFSTSFVWRILPSVPLWKISRTLISFLPPAFISFLSPILSTDALEDAVASLLFLPAKLTFFVLTCRAITTDAALPFYSRPFRDAFKNALNALFTPSELAQPLKALTSQRMRGVILCEVLRGLYIFLVYQPLYTLHGALDPGFHPDSNPSQRALIVRGIIYTASFFTLLGVSSAILCPLDVVKARLSALYPDEVDDIVTRAGKEGVLIMLKDDKEEDGEEGKILSEREEDEPLVDAASLGSITKEPTEPIPSTAKAFRLRPEPYTSVWHCLRTTLAEEGARPLWRAWWATWIGLNFNFSG